MPILEINAAQIASPTRLQCAYLEGLMLWPDDAIRRTAVSSTTEREFGRELLRSFGEGEIPLPADALLAFIERTSKGPPLEAVQNDARPRFVQGVICARAIFDMVGTVAMGGTPPSRESALDQIVASMTHGGLVAGQRIATASLHRSIWDRLKSVLHLWAAYAAHASRTSECAFPCSAARIPNFLAESEWWLGAAAAIRPNRASTSLLNLADAWRPAPDLRTRLPAVEFSFKGPA